MFHCLGVWWSDDIQDTLALDNGQRDEVYFTLPGGAAQD